jgi:nucleoside-diphosphate-sugar epimerase
MRVLVTGASGMIGRGVAQALIDRGDEVSVLQRRPSGLSCREVLADVTDVAAVRQALTGHHAVVHCAAKVDVVGPYAEFEQVNVGGTRALLGASLDRGVGRFVHVSTPSVAHAGRPLVGVGAEPANPEAARGPYARTKAIAELEALAADGPDLAVLTVRPHLVWGPGDTQLVERIVQRGQAGRLPAIGSGAALIDSTYVDNAVDALVAAVDSAAHGEALVVSNGEPRPVLEMLARICAAAGVPGPRGRVPLPVAAAGGSAAEWVWQRLGRRDVPPLTRFMAEQLGTAHWFDQRRTREVLGWAPRVSLDEGFVELRRWYASR